MHVGVRTILKIEKSFVGKIDQPSRTVLSPKQQSFSQSITNCGMEVRTQAAKDLHQELVKLDKQLRELDALEQNYNNTTSKLKSTG